MVKLLDLPFIRRAGALGALLLIALVPFALVCCKGTPPAPPPEIAVTTPAPADAAPPLPAVAEDTKTTTTTTTTDTADASTATSPPVVTPQHPQPTYTGPIPKTCAVGITGVFEVPDARGLAGKARLRLTSNETLEHGVVHLRYAVEPT